MNFSKYLGAKSKSLLIVYSIVIVVFAIGLLMVVLHKYFDIDIGPYTIPIIGVLWLFAFFYSHKHAFFEKNKDLDEKE